LPGAFREMRRVIADHVRPERLRLCRTPWGP
jgi:hypothetical protein